MATPTFTWQNPNDPRLNRFTARTLVSSAVNSGDSFNPTLSDDDDYYISIHLSGDALVAADRGPFDVAANVARGADTFVVEAGKGAKFTAGDLCLFRNSGGDEVFRATVESISTDTLVLEDRIFVDMDTTFTVEIPGKITVTGNEGAGSGDSLQSRVSTLWLVDLEARVGHLLTRWRYDAGASITIQTTGFTATSMVVTDFLDMYNFYRQDRNTPRDLMSAAQSTPVAAPGNTFDYPWLVHASGHPASRQGASSGMERYAETHPPVRLQVTVSSYVNNGVPNSVVISGFKTVWTPIKSVIAGSGGGGSDDTVVIPIENWNQFQVGDAVVLHDLAAGNQDAVTITVKTFAGSATGQPTLTFGAVPVNDYAVDDVLGILTTETITAPAANGVIYSQEAWTYPLTHYTAGAADPDTYDYLIASTVQGVFGSLKSADKRAGISLSNADEYNCAPIVQECVDTSFGANTNTSAGLVHGVLSAPRLDNSSGYHFRLGGTGDNSKSSWQMGVIDKYGRASTGCAFLIGTNDPGNSIVLVNRGITTAEVTSGTCIIPFKSYVGNNLGGPTISSQDGSFSFRRNILAMNPNFGSQLTRNSTTRDLYGTFDRAQDSKADAPSEGAQPFNLRDPGDAAKFANLITTSHGTVGVNFDSPIDRSASEILRLKNLNSGLLSGVGDLSTRVRFRQFQASEFIGALVDSYMRRIVITHNASAATKKRTLQSRHSLNVQVIDETGEPIEGASVVLIDNDDPTSPQVDTTTNFAGVIAEQEIISHRWEFLNTLASLDFTVTKISGFATGVTYFDYNPYELIITGGAANPGYVPVKIDFDLPPFMPTPLNFVIVLHVPRPDGQFGDAGFGEF